MMRSRLLMLGFTVVLASCASSPSPVYLTLDVPHSALPVQPGQRAVVVGPVSVPEIVDRPQLMLSTAPNRVEPAPRLRWAQPYKHEIAQALAAQLAQAAANPRIVPAAAALPDEPYLRVVVDLLHVELREGDSVSMDVLWSVRENPGGKVLASQRSLLHEAVSGPGGEALAAAQSRALARLATQIAGTLN